MHSPTQKNCVSPKCTILMLLMSFLVGTIFLEVIFQLYNESKSHPGLVTRSAAPMLKRSQMLLAKEVILEPTSLFSCTNDSSNIGYPVYIIVKTVGQSSGDYFRRRMFTRLTWAQEARAHDIPVIYAIGRSNDKKMQKELEEEHRTYGDILQFNFIGELPMIEIGIVQSRFIHYFYIKIKKISITYDISSSSLSIFASPQKALKYTDVSKNSFLLFTDAYYNITLKITGVLHWFLSRGCHKITPYLYYVDDDVLINVESLLKIVYDTEDVDANKIRGLYIPPVRPHPIGKWAISLEDYPNVTYPAYITGASALYPSNLIPNLVSEMFRIVELNVPIIFLDDLFVTAIVAENIGIKRANMNGIKYCSHTDLLRNVLINHCDNDRRTLVWRKFLLARVGQDTSHIDAELALRKYFDIPIPRNRTRYAPHIMSSNTTICPHMIPVFICNYRSKNITVILIIILIMMLCHISGIFEMQSHMPNISRVTHILECNHQPLESEDFYQICAYLTFTYLSSVEDINTSLKFRMCNTGWRLLLVELLVSFTDIQECIGKVRSWQREFPVKNCTYLIPRLIEFQRLIINIYFLALSKHLFLIEQDETFERHRFSTNRHSFTKYAKFATIPCIYGFFFY
uniref:Beta-1,3-galactosyltransferase 1-like protein n=1 Tax=Adineta vaga TaxID=104782 RepID=B3G4H9_ADIVA|nr:beta-1,3-galactosyltransferase 1-like protein [Adineta vaga]